MIPTAAQIEGHGTGLAGWKVGQLVDVPTLGRCEVIGLVPPSLLELRTAERGCAC
jgi:hypothetical protein